MTAWVRIGILIRASWRFAFVGQRKITIGFSRSSRWTHTLSFGLTFGKSVELVHEGQALPDPQSHLQKFAFVRKAADTSTPEILLLDMQARADEVANFFQKHFLRCQFCKDDTTRTKEFYSHFRNWVNRKVGGNEITPQQATDLMKASDAALRSQNINVEEFARAHLVSPERVDDLLEYFADKGLRTRGFSVDRETATRFLRTRKIRLDKAEIKIKEADLATRASFSSTETLMIRA